MTYLDWVIIGVLAICLLLCIIRGFIRQAMGLLILGVALVSGWIYRSQVGGIFENQITLDWLRDLCGFFIIFALVMLCGSLLTWIFVRLKSILGLGILDRLLGLILGSVLGFLLVWTGLAVIQRLPFSQPVSDYPWWNDSQLRPVIVNLGDTLLEHVDISQILIFLRESLDGPADLPDLLRLPDFSDILPSDESGAEDQDAENGGTE